MRLCVVFPVFNHGDALCGVIARLPARLPCIIVDDGSDANNKLTFARIASRRPDIVWVTRERNGGKGAAVKDGLRSAAAHGYTHALQLDADGQHDLHDIEQFIGAAEQAPDAFIIGTARFDESVPFARRVGRHLTHFWVHVNTLSGDIRDSMCGFRVYPLRRTLPLLPSCAGNRMDFDIEVVVRAHWSGVPIRNVPTSVRYPAGGISHFRSFHDNALISWMHTRCFAGMLLRLPSLLHRRFVR